MRQIDAAIQQWALEKGKKDTDPIDGGTVATYLHEQVLPKCPVGASAYTLAASVGTTPSVTCPNAALTPPHVLP